MDGDLRFGDMNNGKESTSKDNVRFTNLDNSNPSGCLRPRSPDKWNSRGYLKFKNNSNSEDNLRFSNLDSSNGSGCLRLRNNVYLRLKEI